MLYFASKTPSLKKGKVYIEQCSKNSMVGLKKGRPEGPDIRKASRIIKILYEYPDGLWLRRLARETRLPVSTVSYYVNNILKSALDNVGYTENGKYFGIRLVKLKPLVIKNLERGITIKKLIEIMKIMKLT